MKYLIILILLFSCAEEKKSSLTPEQSQAQIAKAATEDGSWKFKVHVHYEVKAEPYEGTINLGQSNTWDITKASLVSLFQHIRGRTVESPVSLSEMKQITPQRKDSWSTSDLIEVAEKFAQPLLGNFEINTYVIFLNGKFNNSSNILGVHLTGKNYVFIFKDVVESVGGTENQQKYVEQATVVHELGHLIGLVNNGIKPMQNHEDQANPHHTIHRDCVMYHAVEKPNQILSTLSTVIGNQDLNLFGNQVISDVSNH